MASEPKSKSVQTGFIAGGIIVMIAVSGYFVGLRQTHSAISLSRPATAAHGDRTPELTGGANVPIAVRYIDQDWSAHGRNAEWRTTLADFHAPPPPAPPDRVVAPEERAAALRERAARRAYDGAPPVVPHPITQDSSAACLACHGEGLRVKDRFASKMSHATFGGSCTQCHVSSHRAVPAAEAERLAAPLTENTFAGLEAPVAVARAWKGAPAPVPHRTLMRSDCMSCHGPGGLFALRTPHPERQSCTQCHAPAAENDQRIFIPAPPLDAAPTP